MSKIICDSRGFNVPYANINGFRIENIFILDICRAIVTVGNSGFLEFIKQDWRSLGAKLCDGIKTRFLLQNKDGFLVVSPAFTSLTSSEKGTTSYWLGMAFTKLIAEKRLSIPWLSHVDKLNKLGILQLTQDSYERPDLVGKDRNHHWHVFESKGRSVSIGSDLVVSAKRQATKVTSINGEPPATASACVVSLNPNRIKVFLKDPEPDNSFDVHWDISDQYLQSYYYPFIHHLETNDHELTRVLGLDYVTARIDFFGPDVWIGLPRGIIVNPNSAYDVAGIVYEHDQDQERQIPSGNIENKISIGLDGILLSQGFPRR